MFTGDGAGKTTNALGLALRSLGHGHRVVIIQFMKWWKETGENKYQWNKENINSHWKYLLIQLGRKNWHGLNKLTDEDKALTRMGLEMSKILLSSINPPNLLVLDEINLAVSSGLINEDEVLNCLKNVPTKTNIVLTGRNATKGLLDRADFVNIITCVKMPKKMVCSEGIQY